ncbi:serine/threonine protein kinase [Kalymmatonema gypsitolerans NIES-4073]|nr:serine/threonine protein kinase [Scytonema sp. NIES-4073]
MVNDSLIGKTLRNHYKIESLLGQGGFGVTYKAIDIDKPKHPSCVVKQFQPKILDSNILENAQRLLENAQRLFDREARSLEELGKKHDQIPELLAYFREDGEFYLVQEFIDGYDLTKEIVPDKQLSEDAVAQLLKDILEILEFVHQNRIIHRDIKPANLIRRQSDGRIVLIDFGAVKQIVVEVDAQGQRSTTVPVGTFGYMPLEQRNGHPEYSSDIYAVGIIGIQALTGLKPTQLPRDPKTGDVIWQDCAKNVSNRLADIITKMVHDRASSRYQSVREVLGALDVFLTYVPEKYSFLQDCLKRKRWKNADEETVKLMLEVAGRTQQRSMDIDSLKKFPCEDLRIIDALWVRYSNDRFGFSVQHRVWKEVKGDSPADGKVYERFSETVGWRKTGEWIWYTDLIFDISAPPGHLPTGRVGEISLLKRLFGKVGGFGLERINAIAEKLSECRIP